MSRDVQSKEVRLPWDPYDDPYAIDDAPWGEWATLTEGIKGAFDLPDFPVHLPGGLTVDELAEREGLDDPSRLFGATKFLR